MAIFARSERPPGMSGMPPQPDISEGVPEAGAIPDVDQTLLSGPNLAMCGRLPVGKEFLDVDAVWSSAAMCPAC
jgi:hypothetical protein